MQCVLATELAVLVKLDSVRIVFLVLISIVIALFALGACKSNLDSHNYTSKILRLKKAPK